LQVLVLISLVFLALTSAQTTPAASDSGCCFYSQPQYQGDPVICTSENTGFNTEVIIQSYFCTEDYSAAIFAKANLVGDPIELVECGEEQPALLKQMAVNSIAVGRCAQSACCFYSSAEPSAGGEYCISVGAPPPVKEELAAVQNDGKLKLLTCNAGYTARLTYDKGAIDVPCGGEKQAPADVTFTAIAISDCITAPPAKAIDEAAGDFATVDQAVGDYAVDQAVGDYATVDQAVGDYMADQAVADYAVDQAVGDYMADQAVADYATVDQAVGDYATADQAVADYATADQAVGDYATADQAVGDYATADQAVGDYATADQAVSSWEVDGVQVNAATVDDSQSNSVQSSAFSVAASLLVVLISCLATLA